MNPYEFESYNTIRFIQDLAEHYDVLALKKGSLHTLDSTLNRTIFREPYPGSYNFIKKIQSWGHEQGYTYLYLVGYSVGAMVAAQELAVVSPEDWTSPDGLIIITTKIAKGLPSPNHYAQAFSCYMVTGSHRSSPLRVKLSLQTHRKKDGETDHGIIENII